MPAILAAGALALVVTAAQGAEGVLPIRAGDRVSGEVRWCGDRHVLAIELVRGEVFKARVRVGRALADDITVRFYDPTGLSQNTRAVRNHGSVARVGPFRATVSGTHLLQITTFTRHEVPYDVTTSVRARSRRALRLRPGKERTSVAAAGSVLRVRGLAEHAALSLTLPGEAPRTLAAGSACLAALQGDGLTLPAGGRYAFSVDEGAGRPRVVLRPPARAPRRDVSFPELPDDRDAVAAWYDDGTGWLADPALTAPADHDPPASVPVPGDPQPPVAPHVTLLGAAPAPASAAARSGFAQPGSLGAHAPGLGMPIAPMPTVDEALASGHAEPYGDGTSYVYDADVPGLGNVTYRVQFVVGGRVASAPVALGGRTSMRWWATGGGALHEESWTLTFDDVRGVEVLSGSATFIGPGFETVRSAAEAYALPTDGGPASGTLTWGVDSPREGSFQRTEILDGRGAVTVTLR